jgi:hypothetical protein
LKEEKLTIKTYPPLPIVVVMLAMRAGGTADPVSLKKITETLLKAIVENVKEGKTHHHNIHSAAYCHCHVGNEGGRTNFSLWAEFWLIL